MLKYSKPIWYILWSTLLLISAWNTLFPGTSISGSGGLMFSLILATVAGIQLWNGPAFLQKKESDLAFCLLLVFCTAQSIHWVITEEHPTHLGFDFSAYYLAAKVVSENPGVGLYHLPLYADGRMNLMTSAPDASKWAAAAKLYHVPVAAPYIYPPFFAALVRPLAGLSYNNALITWKILMMLLLVAGASFALNAGGMHINRKLALIIGVGLFSYYPFIDSLLQGQSDSLIFFLLAASVWSLSKNHIGTSSLTFAAAALIKLTPVIALPMLVFQRKWKWLAACFAWMSSLLLFSVWQAGWSAHWQFLYEVLPHMSGGVPDDSNTSLVSYVQDLFLGYVPNWTAPVLTMPKYAGAVSRLVALAVYVVMLVRFKRRAGDPVRTLVLMILLSLALSPISWWHHYTIALLPFLYLWASLQGKDDLILLLLFGVASTGIVYFSQIMARGSVLQLVLAAIVPGLTLALVYLRAPGTERPANPFPMPI